MLIFHECTFWRNRVGNFCTHCGIGDKKIWYIVMAQHIIERFVRSTPNQSVRSNGIEYNGSYLSVSDLFTLSTYLYMCTRIHTNTCTSFHLQEWLHIMCWSVLVYGGSSMWCPSFVPLHFLFNHEKLYQGSSTSI